MESENKRNYVVGTVEIALANSFVGINIVINKYLVEKASVIQLLELRYIFGTLILAVFSLFLKKGFTFYLTEEKFDRRNWILYLLMALSGGVLFNLIYMLGIGKTTATSVGVISSSIPTLIAIFSFFILGQSLKRVHFLCVILVVIGILILNMTGNKSHSGSNTINSYDMFVGNVIVFLAMIPEALFTILAKLIRIKVCPVVSGLLINFINALVCLPFVLLGEFKYGIFEIEFSVWVFSFFIGLINGALFYTLYNKGIAKIDSQTAAIMTGMVPISSALFGIVFLREPFYINTFIGIVCVLSSIYIGVRFGESSKVLLRRVRQK
ncbi:DMT family transporter [Fluviispira multicolorata]|uniref:EamA family transporter n=1 Tax=Fluviispira multicolorata TaxID=2654512 RepID=A0A833JEV0_9BACT|nr:DMT family transporter [Fluviispira multicolorata]KAB8033405.1 EamA family transporter [Fluviispira multicolorata]